MKGKKIQMVIRMSKIILSNQKKINKNKIKKNNEFKKKSNKTMLLNQ